MSILSKEELKDLAKIKNTYYMIPILEELNKNIQKYGLEKSLNYLHSILISSKDKVEDLLDNRVNTGEIKDKSQARKSIAGNAFSLLIKYIFINLKQEKIIKNNIFITSNPKRHALISEMVTIHVGEDTQKPDMDLAIYSINDDNSLNKCFIMSLKTSLRESRSNL